jgi:hypothetical protein
MTSLIIFLLSLLSGRFVVFSEGNKKIYTNHAASSLLVEI